MIDNNSFSILKSAEQGALESYVHKFKIAARFIYTLLIAI